MRKTFLTFLFLPCIALAGLRTGSQLGRGGGLSHFQSVTVTPPITLLTNPQKLSLTPNTPVGTQVSVSDGFVVSGGDYSITFFYPAGAWLGKTFYLTNNPATTGPSGSGAGSVFWDTNRWVIASLTGDLVAQSFDDTEFPWLATTWVDNSMTPVSPLLLTHPAVQTLAAPSSAQGGVFVSGGTQDGVYAIYTESGNSRREYLLLGDGSPPDHHIAWDEVDRWIIYHENGDGPIYYSLSDVATADLAINWKNASDDSPAAISVTSVTAGQIAAGIRYGANAYVVSTATNGRNSYADVLGIAPSYTWDGTKWTDGTHNGTGNTAFPWSATGITITQDNVAAEANWTNQ